jgi:3-methyl-2-oxobutanoate hydroxymethyltransferase
MTLIQRISLILVNLNKSVMSVNKEIKRITTVQVQEMKHRHEKIAMLTGYDFTMAKALDEGGIDIILVGDSAANVFAGYETTLPITLDHMIYHAASVVRGTTRALVLVDLPFGEYQGSVDQAAGPCLLIGGIGESP